MEVVGVWEACLVSCASAVLSSELQLRGLQGEGEEGTAHAAACLSACALTRVRANTQLPLTATSTLRLLLRCTEEVLEKQEVGGGGVRLLRTLRAMLEAALHSPALEDGDAAEVCLAMCERGMAIQGDTAEGEGRQIQDTLQVARQALSSAHTRDVWECALDALESSAAAARESRATAQLAATAARAAREGHRTFSLARTRAHASIICPLNDEVIELL